MFKTPYNFAEGSFSTKLTKLYRENQGWNVLYISAYDVTHIEFNSIVTSWLRENWSKDHKTLYEALSQ